MRRLAALLFVLSLLAAACGSDGDTDEGSQDAAREDGATTTTVTDGSNTTLAPAGAPTAPNATGTGQGATAGGAGAGAAGAGATTTTAKSSSGGSNTNAAGAGKAAPGTYTYNRTGKANSNVFGDQSLDGPVSLKVDPPNGDEQRAVQSSSEATIEQVLRFLPEGAYITFLKQTNRGLSKEFRPNPAVLAIPADPAVGRTWSWTVTSSDGATTLNAGFKVERNETLNIGGEQVPTVVVSIVLTTSGDIEMTTNQTRWISTAKGLTVRTDETSNGRAGSITLSSQYSMTLTSTKAA